MNDELFQEQTQCQRVIELKQVRCQSLFASHACDYEGGAGLIRTKGRPHLERLKRLYDNYIITEMPPQTLGTGNPNTLILYMVVFCLKHFELSVELRLP